MWLFTLLFALSMMAVIGALVAALARND